MTPLTTAERSGVVDVLPWSGDTLLVPEREFGGRSYQRPLAIKLYTGAVAFTWSRIQR